MDLKDFNYELPEERIAKQPLNDRSEAKLLVYNRGRVNHSQFKQVMDHLPEEGQLVVNDTKVIPARFKLTKETGAIIEVFLLNPVGPSNIISEVMTTTQSCRWKCMIGNKKRWKGEVLTVSELIDQTSFTLHLQLPDPENDVVEFYWDNGVSFAAIVEKLGKVPLPPYLNRAPTPEDKLRYQTVYSHYEGAVAAPTAGLHFTEEILGQIRSGGMSITHLTLHVGAGTFLPITESSVVRHNMHEEQIVIHRKSLQALLKHQGPIIPVGTTSMRTLESIYWYGVLLRENSELPFTISQDTPYRIGFEQLPERAAVMQTILNKMDTDGVDSLVGTTGIFIYPGYHFQMCDALITNFHQPKSTLILLVAAFIGEDWKKVYEEALRGGYRFLSYGDSSLLIPR